MRNNVGEARRSYSIKYGKFTQEDAARYFGVAASTYKNWEQGVGKLNGELLCAIADKYECSIDYLLLRTQDPRPYPSYRESYKDDGERRLVSAYRECTPREKASILMQAETMADDGNAKNMDDSGASRSEVSA